jgi:hypothetical protein
MDARKCADLKAKLSAQAEPWIVPIEVFFDGNDDEASIGCNLNPHPGIDVFRSVLLGILGRSDVEAAYAQISELDPGEECWPFAHWVFVVGTILPDDLANAFAPLQPDDVGPPGYLGVPEAITGQLMRLPSSPGGTEPRCRGQRQPQGMHPWHLQEICSRHARTDPIFSIIRQCPFLHGNVMTNHEQSLCLATSEAATHLDLDPFIVQVSSIATARPT